MCSHPKQFGVLFCGGETREHPHATDRMKGREQCVCVIPIDQAVNHSRAQGIVNSVGAQVGELIFFEREMDVIENVVNINTVLFEDGRNVGVPHKLVKDVVLMAVMYFRSFVERVVNAMRECRVRDIVNESGDLLGERRVKFSQ